MEPDAPQRRGLAYDPLEVELLAHVGGMHMRVNELEQVATALEAALALATHGARDDGQLAKLETNLGIVLAKLGRFEDAERALLGAY